MELGTTDRHKIVQDMIEHGDGVGIDIEIDLASAAASILQHALKN